ncbi:MAG: cupin domain-containing protein [Armatimonadota bacterium]|nr:cupin domain-containing protein [Armatimonadota bacterium]MDR5689833.1 cupin domain-containing protein [Armatimonadota bacterium]MDR7389145.1 cupin domain-containing protein [Armatimonadota bacterium]MDR7396741.1 cupin domain-containing protein [Armatimonadota bacterium]MDR7398308.1 cupin domain-containing protein [Armatimonadota bacterium]
MKTSTWQEPVGDRRAGYGRWKRPPSVYDRFMESEGIPVYRGIGVRRVQDLQLGPWRRLGGRGAYVQLYGTEGIWGMYLVEIPPSGALEVERHLYEEVVYVVEGRGATEVWVREGGRREVFEWQPGSLFTVPLNTYHRFLNGLSSGPALLLVGTTAPAVMNLFGSTDFVFNCPYVFRDRYDEESEDYFRPKLEEVEPDPYRGLAMVRTNFVPDVRTLELPLDNRRSPGSRRLEPHLDRNVFYLWVGQHESGRYSKAHAHESAAVLICVQGKGYTYAWPRAVGTRPWETGQAHRVVRQDYEPVGLVSAAPMGGEWFHQHFSVGREPLRLMAWFGPFGRGTGREPGRPGEEVLDKNALDLAEGGSAIPYWDEDPHIRREYEETLQREGVSFRMEERFYRRPEEAWGAGAGEPR